MEAIIWQNDADPLDPDPDPQHFLEACLFIFKLNLIYSTVYTNL